MDPEAAPEELLERMSGTVASFAEDTEPSTT